MLRRFSPVVGLRQFVYFTPDALGKLVRCDFYEINFRDLTLVLLVFRSFAIECVGLAIESNFVGLRFILKS